MPPDEPVGIRGRLPCGAGAKEADQRLVETLEVGSTEAFAPEFDAALEPDLVGKVTATGGSIVGRITVGLDKVLKTILVDCCSY